MGMTDSEMAGAVDLGAWVDWVWALKQERDELRILLDAPAQRGEFKRIEMAHVVNALEDVRGKPVLTSNQCHDLARALNDRLLAPLQLLSLPPEYLAAAQSQDEHTAVGFLERMLKGSGDDLLEAWQGEMAMLLEHIAEQPQGDPVACAHGIRAPHACDQCEAQNLVPDYWEDPDTGTCIDQWSKVQGLNGTEAYTVPLYRHAEQPAPVSVVLPERMPGDDGVCTESHYALGWNACLDEVAEINVHSPDGGVQ